MTKTCYAILRHGRKLHDMPSIRAIANHNRRSVATPNADPDKQNKTLVGSGDFSRDVLERLPEKRRKNAVIGRELFLSASPEYFQDDENGKKIEAWKTAALDYLRATYAERQIAGVVMHLDEQTPHLHVMIVPLREDGKLDARSLWTRPFLQQSQTKYAKACAHLGLSRGTEGSKAEHESISNYYKRVNEPAPNLPPQIEPPPEKSGILDFGHAQRAAEHAAATAQRTADVEQIAVKLHAKAREFDNIKAKLHERERQLEAMRNETIRLREIPLELVLESMGCERDKSDKKNWKTPIGRVTVDGEKFYCHDLQKGGGGAIDLTMMLDGCDFKSAVKTLGGVGFDRNAIASAAAQKIVQMAAEKPEFREPDEADFEPAHKYLRDVRRIPSDVIRQAEQMAKIFCDSFQNLCFRLDPDPATGKPAGVEMRGTRPGKTFHGVRGKKRLFRFDDTRRRPPGAPKKAVFVESGIEALSYAALNPGCLVLGSGGQNNSEIMDEIKKLNAVGYQIIAAQNNDPAGKKQAEFVIEKAGPGTKRHAPPDGQNDWNDVLRASQTPATRPAAAMNTTPTPAAPRPRF